MDNEIQTEGIMELPIVTHSINKPQLENFENLPCIFTEDVEDAEHEENSIVGITDRDQSPMRFESFNLRF